MFEAHINGLVQDCSKSIALAMELLQSCTKPLILIMHIMDPNGTDLSKIS